MRIVNIAIFASGNGSNANRIIEFFEQHPFIKVALVLSNKSDAGVLDVGRSRNVKTAYVSKSEFYDSNRVITLLRGQEISWIVLAGFLLKVPQDILESYPDRILNIHPSLLPKFGGKGMYGMHVHKAVKESGDDLTGITIHVVNHEYDKGRVICQITCPVKFSDRPEEIQRKVQILEHAHYPNVIAQEILRSLMPIY